MKKLLVLFMCAFLLCFGMVACGDEEPQKTEFTQSEVATLDDVNYSILKVEKSKGNDWDYPAEGKEYVIVTVKIENNSEEKISYNALDWQMVNSKGQEDSEAFTTIINDTSLGSGELNKGGYVEGDIAFEEPIGDKGLKLVYYSNLLFDDEPAFSFTLD